MFSTETLSFINMVAYELSIQGRQERDAIALVTDPRRKNELEAVIESARLRQTCLSCSAA